MNYRLTKSLATFALSLFLFACGAHNQAFNVLDDKVKFAEQTYVVGEVSNGTGFRFDVDIETEMSDALTGKLAKADLLVGSEAGELVIGVDITEYQKGNAFKRWLAPGYGSTKLAVQATISSKDGTKVATANVLRTVDVGGAYSVGAWKTVFGKVADDIVDELKKEF